MSGKKKSFPPARTRRVNLRITEDLYDVLQTEATASDLSLSDYVRKILTSRHPTIKRTTEVVYDDPKLLQIFRDLRGCGTNLNQIAAYLNGGGTMTNQMWKEIKDCISEIYEMRDAVKEMAGEYRGYH
jgi:uncharacterized protein (DUF1778 family)